VDGRSDLGDACAERMLVEARLRVDLCAEETEREPAEAAERRETVPPRPRLGDRGGPVEAEADVACAQREASAVGRKDDAGARDGRRALLEQRRRRLRA